MEKKIFKLLLPGLFITHTGGYRYKAPIRNTGRSGFPSTSNKFLVWLMIFSAAIAPGFFTYKLTGDMDKKAGD
jgi:hypothetical protein